MAEQSMQTIVDAVRNLTLQQWLALGLGALLVFWVLGAYNRLVALRNTLAQAWGKVDETLRQRSAALQPLLTGLQVPMAAEHGALAVVDAAHADAVRAAAAMAAKPAVEANATAWVGAEAALTAAASRLLALLDHHAELRLQEPVASNAAAWRDAQSRLAFARQWFNDAALAYNDAIAVFPTRLLVPLFGFERAGRL